MDDEETTVLPLVTAHLTVDEWEELGRRGLAEQSRAEQSKKQMMESLSALLDIATPAERDMFLRKVPLIARVMWRLVGRRAHQRAKLRLYGSAA
ncbi:hypothetical protein [Nocardia sp. NPDC020380]|uniref:hypothetical protein n=1 Tax=Nocardia sp. NPDC020380 TaxID=3364309 RepID=UPI00379AAB07